MKTTDINAVSPQPSPRITFQSNPTSSTKKVTSSLGGKDDTSELELSHDEISDSSLTQLFTTIVLLIKTSKDAILNGFRDTVINGGVDQCHWISPHIHLFWRYLFVKSGCFCVNNRGANPHDLRDEVMSRFTKHPRLVAERFPFCNLRERRTFTALKIVSNANNPLKEVRNWNKWYQFMNDNHIGNSLNLMKISKLVYGAQLWVCKWKKSWDIVFLNIHLKKSLMEDKYLIFFKTKYIFEEIHE